MCRRRGKAALALGCALALVTIPRATGRSWTGLIDSTGHCYYAVPPDWKIDEQSESTNPLTTSPDGRASAVLHWSRYSSWTQFTARLRSTVEAIVVREDSARRFWIDYAPAWPGVHHVVAIPAAQGACTMEVDVSEKAAPRLHAIVRDIIGTIAALR